MAYMNQERKQALVAELRKVMPVGWKYSVSVHHHSTLVLTIAEAPVDILGAVAWERGQSERPKYWDLNEYYIDRQFTDPALVATFTAIRDALNTGNHDRSDIQSDYFEVGWYLSIHIGRWDRPFRFTGAPAEVSR